MNRTRVLCGLDSLTEAEPWLNGRRIGLMTNHTGINSRFQSAADLIHERYRLTALFAPEHGIRGAVQAGEAFEKQTDPATQTPVYPVYGKTRRMTADMLDVFDVLCFDMQDVGARFYTYLYALSFAMEACAAAGKRMVVFDRVNPLGGEKVQGTVLDHAFSSYVGMYPLPTRYGLTIGEYALWVKNYLKLDVDLKVIPLRGWRRHMYLDDLDIPWAAPSPNCAAFHTALVYPGTCVFEGTNLSEGRGTTMPFEYIGAPWIDAQALEKRMARRELPGLHFRAAYFSPTFSKYQGRLCAGVQVHVTDRDLADVTEGALALLDEIRDMYPAMLEWTGSAPGSFTIDKLLGTDSYRRGLKDAHALISAHQPQRQAFVEERKPFLLYD